jgi:subtilisin-like proprotein convertase family protein
MLEANPDLGWRDVQHIVAHTARKVDVDDTAWVTNGVGLSHSDKYGFGIVDAGAATQMAQAWTSANSTQWCVHSITVDSNLAIPMEVEGTCSVIVAASEVQSLEHVVVYLNASHANRGDLELRLTSPSGTESVLLASHNDDEEGFYLWKLMSVVYWGEVPLGTWELSVLDKRDNGLDGNLSAFILALYGKCAASASFATFQDFGSECATVSGTTDVSDYSDDTSSGTDSFSHFFFSHHLGALTFYPSGL